MDNVRFVLAGILMVAGGCEGILPPTQDCPSGQVRSGDQCVPVAISCAGGGLTVCSGPDSNSQICTDIRNDPQNCGACGNACPAPAGAGTPVCIPDGDTGRCDVVCTAGLLNCNGNNVDGCEVSPAGDRNNCGGCGIVCQGPSTVSCCAGKCVDTNIDPNNCGGCSSMCEGTDACKPGMPPSPASCMSSCGAGLMKCNRYCVNTMSDPANCGGCNIVCPSGVCLAAIGKCYCYGTVGCPNGQNCNGSTAVCP